MHSPSPSRSIRRLSGIVAAVLWLAGMAVPGALAQIAVTDSVTSFNPVVTSGGALMTDPFNDQQTGQKQSDFMSFTAGTTGIYVNGAATTSTITSDVGGFYVKSGTIANDATNTYLMFRFVFHDANQAKPYEGSHVLIGVDLSNDGTPDLIFGVDSTNATPKLEFLKAGTGANTSPSTTTVASYTTTASTTLSTSSTTQPVTFAYTAAPVTYDVVANSKATNMYFTFAISYANLQQSIRDMGIVNGVDFSTFTVTGSTAMTFLAYTSQQGNAFNQDIYGGAISQNSSTTWTALGAFSTSFTADGNVVPTPELPTFVQSGALLVMGPALLAWRRWRRRQPAGGAARS